MRRVFQYGILLGVLALAGGIIAPPALDAQVRTKRIILKDGSYQPATKWEVKGERVRYYSAERFAWEELPNSLVDWPATEKFNADLSAPSAATLEAEAELKAERAKEEEASPLASPGIRLPATGGVYMLDTYRDEPQLVEMVQSGGEINKQTGKNILRAAINPIASAKQAIELKGPKAAVQAHVSDPVLFANVSAAEPEESTTPNSGRDLDQDPGRYRIVRVESKKDTRVVGNIKIAMTGHVSEQEDYVKTKSEPMTGGWVRIIPQGQLTPGEYALVEMLGPKQMNLYVWDFGVNPRAPQNASAWKPNALPEVKTGTTETPVLKKKKKP